MQGAGLSRLPLSMQCLRRRLVPRHWRTFTTGARQLVVQEAAVTMWSLAALYRCCVAQGWVVGLGIGSRRLARAHACHEVLLRRPPMPAATTRGTGARVSRNAPPSLEKCRVPPMQPSSHVVHAIHNVEHRLRVLDGRRHHHLLAALL